VKVLFSDNCHRYVSPIDATSHHLSQKDLFLPKRRRSKRL
jgi:hypothetical protein